VARFLPVLGTIVLCQAGLKGDLRRVEEASVAASNWLHNKCFNYSYLTDTQQWVFLGLEICYVLALVFTWLQYRVAKAKVMKQLYCYATKLRQSQKKEEV
jgi:hypothetical protein